MAFISDSVRAYLTDIGKYPLLSAEEELELAYKIKNGDTEAKQKMIASNLRLVVDVAKKHKPPTLKMDFLDYVSYGNLGLIKAVDRYDPDKGFKFSTYATWWIRQALIRYTQDYDDIIRLPVHMHERMRKYRTFINRYIQENMEPPTDEVIIKELGITQETLEQYRKNYNLFNTDSLDRTIDGGGKTREDDSKIGDFVAVDEEDLPDEQAMAAIKREEAESLLNSKDLTGRERKILSLRFGFVDNRPRTLEEIGQEFGVTRERIRQIESKAIRKIKNRYRMETQQIAHKVSKKSNGKVVVHGYISQDDIVVLKCVECGYLWRSITESALENCECRKCKERKAEEMRNKKEVYELLGISKDLEGKFIDLLSDSEKKLIELRRERALSRVENQLFDGIIDKLRTAVNRYKESGVITSRRIKSIYDLVGADKELVDKAIETLPDFDKKLIKKRDIFTLTEEEDSKFTGIVEKLRRRVNNYNEMGNFLKEKKKMPLHERVGAPKEVVDKLIEGLSLEERDLIEKRKIFQLNKEEDIKITQIVIKLQRKLKGNKNVGEINMNRRNVMSIHERVGANKELVDKLVAYLSDEEKALIETRNERELSPNEQTKFTVIVLKLKRWVNKYNETGKLPEAESQEELKKKLEKVGDTLSKKKKTFAELVSVDEETVKRLIDTLNDEEREFIKVRDTRALDREESKRLNAIVQKLKYRYNKGQYNSEGLSKPVEKEPEKKSVYEIIGADKEIVDKLIETLTPPEKNAIKRYEDGTLIIELHGTFKSSISKLRIKLETYMETGGKEITRKAKEVHELVGAPKEVVDKLIEGLTPEEKLFIDKKNNHTLVQSDYPGFYGVIDKLKKVYESTKKVADNTAGEGKEKELTVRPKKSIYEIIGEDKELIDKAIETLYDGEKALIKKRETEALTQPEHNKFYSLVGVLGTRIRRYKSTGVFVEAKPEKKLASETARPYKKALEGIAVDKPTTDEPSEVLKRLKGEKVEFVPANEGAKTIEVNDVTKSDVAKNSNGVIADAIEVYKKEICPPEKDLYYAYYKELLSIVIKDRVVREEIDWDHLIITSLRYGIGKGVAAHSVEATAKYFGISEEEVERITSETIPKLNKRIQELVEGTKDYKQKEKNDDNR